MPKSKEIFLSVVIPAYNEEKRILKSLEKIYEYLNSQLFAYEIIISDDGSVDSTRSIVKRFQEDWKELILLENKHKGKAPAVIAGVKKAKGKNILFTDTDLSVSIEEVGKMLPWTENQGYDVVIASREGPSAVRMNEPYIRHFMGRVFNLIVQMLVLPGINDTQCGFKLFKHHAAHEIIDVLRVRMNSISGAYGSQINSEKENK
jgi:dolichyl-phosphate beta-glucosyltransferase